MPLYPPAGGGGGGGNYQTVEANAVPLTQRPALNFTGPGFTGTDDAGNSSTDILIAGSRNTPTAGTGSMIAPVQQANSTNWATAAQLRYALVYLPAIPFKGLSFRINTVGAGSLIRAAVYNYNTVLGSPSTQVAATAVSFTPVSAPQNVSALFGANWTPAAAGLFYLAMAIDAGTAQTQQSAYVYPFQAFALAGQPPSESAVAQDFVWTTGALPASAFAGAATVNPNLFPSVGIILA